MVFDYQKIGLRVGLEIHQQLDTKKLFCNCPSIIRDDDPDKTVKRTLRASAGESGNVDVAASYEMEKKKYFIYEYYFDTTCDVELDEEPPNNINRDALDIVLQIAKIVNADIVDQIHIMRKTVVDGSNTTGFQRTALIAINGEINVELSDNNNLKVPINTLCLEEDAARIIKRENEYDVYRLDRLGIPLIEIATAPAMYTPSQVKDVAAYIGMLLRSTGRVKRGLGTIRQDVNVSIDGGARVEIKGVQDLRMIDKVVELEVLRQLNLIKLREEMLSRGINSRMLISEIYDFTEYFSDTQSNLIKKNVSKGLFVYGQVYKNFKGFFGFEINPGRRFGSELSDRIKIYGLNGLIHTDEDLNKYGILDNVKNIYSKMNLASEDSLILIIGSYEQCKQAFFRILETIKDLIDNGLSKEVRNAREDGTSVFLRPMPSSSRMYPETDVPVFTPSLENIKSVELINDKIARFEKEYGLPKQVAKELVFTNFEYFVKKYPQIPPITIAETLTAYPKEIKTLYNKEIDISLYADDLFFNINNGVISTSAIKPSLLELANGCSLNDVISKYKLVDEEEIVSYITKLISEHPNHNVNALMGEVMKKYRGKFPGQRIMELIKKFKDE